MSISFQGHANQLLNKDYLEIKSVSSAAFNNANDSLNLIVSYPSGGCDPKEREHKLKLDLINIKDITSEFANSQGIKQYDVKVRVKVMEEALKRTTTCPMAYSVEIVEDLKQLFSSVANEWGINLKEKNKEYSVSFTLAPKIVSSTSFVTFD